jgi:hypothetical protein
MNRIILITTLFHHESSIRNKEFKKCILVNTRNPLIDKLIIFFEEKNKSDFSISHWFSELQNEKIEFKHIETTPTFKMFFDYANQYFKGDYIIIANTDIFFEDQSGIEQIKFIKPNHLWLLTRYSFNPDQGKWILEDAGLGFEDRMLGSHDVWCFLSPIKDFDNNIIIGKQGCDSYLAQKAIEASITLSNPSYSIRVKHNHSNKCSYGQQKDYQLKKDYMHLGSQYCFPPVSYIGQDYLTPFKRKIEILKYYMKLLRSKIIW